MAVFISHKMNDRSKFDWLAGELKNAGISYWDPGSMTVGVTLADQLANAINTCDSCVFLATQDSVKAEWCFTETGAFWGAGKKLVAFLGDDGVTQDQLPPMITKDLAASDIPRLVKFLKNDALGGAAGKDSVLFS